MRVLDLEFHSNVYTSIILILILILKVIFAKLKL